MMTVIVTVFEDAGLTVSEKRIETMLLRTLDQTTHTPPLVIETADQRYKQTAQLLHLGSIIHENADLPLEIDTTDPSHTSMPQTVRPGVV